MIQSAGRIAAVDGADGLDRALRDLLDGVLASAPDGHATHLSGLRHPECQPRIMVQCVAQAAFEECALGESRPQDRNDTIEGRARNRRVELVRQ